MPSSTLGEFREAGDYGKSLAMEWRKAHNNYLKGATWKDSTTDLIPSWPFTESELDELDDAHDRECSHQNRVRINRVGESNVRVG